MLELSIVSVSIDSPEWAELLVKSVWKFTKDVNYEIVIVDNGSLDVNLTWLRKQAKLGNIRLLERGWNSGHGPAMDFGTKLAHAPFCGLLFQRFGHQLGHIAHFDFDIALQIRVLHRTTIVDLAFRARGHE